MDYSSRRIESILAWGDMGTVLKVVVTRAGGHLVYTQEALGKEQVGLICL